MTNQQIIKFIADNKGDQLTDYYNKTYDKLKDLSQRSYRTTLYLILTVFIYYITSRATLSSIQLGPFTVSDFEMVPKLTPLVFSYLLLEYCIIANHRAELLKVTRWIVLSTYKQELTEKDIQDGHYNFFTRMVLPYSFWTQIEKMNDTKGGYGCVGIILILPLLLLLFLPFYFEYITIRHVALNYWNDFMGKVSVVLSTWMALGTIYFYIRLLPEEYRKTQSQQ